MVRAISLKFSAITAKSLDTLLTNVEARNRKEREEREEKEEKEKEKEETKLG